METISKWSGTYTHLYLMMSSNWKESKNRLFRHRKAN